MRILRPAHGLALTLILTVLLGACGGGVNYAAGGADGASADPNVPTAPTAPSEPSVPSEPTVVDPVTTVSADNALAQVGMSVPPEFDVGNELRIVGAGAGGWKATPEGRQEIKMESLIGKKWKRPPIPGGGGWGVLGGLGVWRI